MIDSELLPISKAIIVCWLFYNSIQRCVDGRSEYTWSYNTYHWQLEKQTSFSLETRVHNTINLNILAMKEPINSLIADVDITCTDQTLVLKQRTLVHSFII